MERTDSDILSKKPVKVVLGERTFMIKPQARGKSRAFRKEFQQRTAGIGTADLEKQDELVDLVYLYSPELEEAKDYIEEHATDTQVVDAFTVIMGLVFGPFVKEFPEKLAAVFSGTDVEKTLDRKDTPESP